MPTQPTQTQFYCLSCKGSREIVDAETVTDPKGRTAVRGKCSVCEGKMYQLITKPTEL